MTSAGLCNGRAAAAAHVAVCDRRRWEGGGYRRGMAAGGGGQRRVVVPGAAVGVRGRVWPAPAAGWWRTVATDRPLREAVSFGGGGEACGKGDPWSRSRTSPLGVGGLRGCLSPEGGGAAPRGGYRPPGCRWQREEEEGNGRR